MESPEFPHLSSTERHLSGSESVSDNLTEALPSSRTEQRTYKLLRNTMRLFEEGSGSARLVEAPVLAGETVWLQLCSSPALPTSTALPFSRWRPCASPGLRTSLCKPPLTLRPGLGAD